MNIPVLLLHGKTDCQVSKIDFQIWEKTFQTQKNKDWVIKSFPNLNHLSMKVEGKSTGKEHGISGHVDQQVLKTIIDWIKTI